MSFWKKIYYKLFSLLLNLVVKSQSVPENPSLELKLDSTRPVVYVLLYYSSINFLILRNQCLKNDLPDPLDPLTINGTILSRYICIYSPFGLTRKYKVHEKSIRSFYNYLKLYNKNSNLDIQMTLVSIMWKRYPNHRKKQENQSFSLFNVIKKIFMVVLLGCDSFIQFSPFISLQEIVTKFGTNKIVIDKLLRIARKHFCRQYLATVGPYLLERQNLFDKLLISKEISRAIKDEIKNKKISYNQAKKNAIKLMKEITANFSYEMIRLADRVLSFSWNYLYQKINVKNAEQIRKLTYDGHEIVYIPCHRSHMDYLLISYVIYHHGLLLPHIAAGINLNFWPIGSIFRRLGAFFIRRTFKSNKLYSAVFRGYLNELFNHGYSIEYFIEGSRSRTGRLLDPKTGILSITVQAMLRNSNRKITLVPIYIGYEHLIEENGYSQEILSGITKKRENILQMLFGFKKLRNLGQGYINFGEPLSLSVWLNQHVPEWEKSINSIESIRPVWLTPTVNNIAFDLMTRINSAGAINAINLCCTILLASPGNLLTKRQLIEQLDCYISLIKNVPYSTYLTISSLNSNELFEQALKTDKFRIKKTSTEEDNFLILCKKKILLTYYRNNVFHILILPSLIASMIIQNSFISYQELFYYTKIIYPMLKAELFLRWNYDELMIELNKLIKELIRQELVIFKNNKLQANSIRFHVLKLLAQNVQTTLQRYAITFWILSQDSCINRKILEKNSQILTKKIFTLHNINPMEFSDKAIFTTLIATLRNEGYICNTKYKKSTKIIKVYYILANLITPKIRSEIESN